MWQLHFFRFLKNVFLIILEMRCLLVPSKYERKYYTIILACWVLICGLVFCGTFVWHIEITLQLRFVFVCHCDIFQTSQLHYLSFQRFTFLMTSELHWIMEIVRTCELFIEVTLSFFSNIIFLAPHLFDNVDIDVKKNDVKKAFLRIKYFSWC